MKKIYFDIIDSTQSYAKKIFYDEAESFVIISKQQSKGKGRNGHEWVSPFGGLWFSFSKYIGDFTVEEVNLLTLAIGIAVRDACTEMYRCNLKIKWPNDLILNNKKVGGIICEKFNNNVIIGIGINTNIEEFSETMTYATSFKKELNKEISNEKLLESIFDKLDERLAQLRENKRSLIECFRENMAFKNEKRYISIINETAVITDINDVGHLIVTVDGNEKEIFMGEVL